MISRRIVVGIGGGIAAFKVATLVSRLVQKRHDVQVVMTESAQQFVGPATFRALTNKPVATQLFDPHWPLGAHIELPEGADLLVVAPATARLLGSFAHGLADCLLSTLYLHCECPVLMAPAMSTPMWEKAAVQRNVKQLQEDGVHFVGPEEGWLSCRKRGAGRMAEPEQIGEAIDGILGSDTEV